METTNGSVQNGHATRNGDEYTTTSHTNGEHRIESMNGRRKDEMNRSLENNANGYRRKRLVVVGLGMVAMAFM